MILVTRSAVSPATAMTATRRRHRRSIGRAPPTGLIAVPRAVCTQGGARECLQPAFADRLPAVVAAAVGAEFDMPQREADCSSISRALLASDISASRSKFAEPTSAGSRPAPSLPSRSSPTSSAVEISIWLEAGDVVGQRLLDLVELSLRPGILAGADRQRLGIHRLRRLVLMFDWYRMHRRCGLG